MTKKPLVAVFAHNIEREMEARPAYETQVKLAKRSKVAQSTIGRILRQEVAPSLDVVEAICDAFGIPASDMLQDRDKRQADNSISLVGLPTAAQHQIRAFVDFVTAQVESGAGSLLLRDTTTPPAAQQAAIMRSFRKPVDEATLEIDETSAAQPAVEPVKRKRGRPRKR